LKSLVIYKTSGRKEASMNAHISRDHWKFRALAILEFFLFRSAMGTIALTRTNQPVPKLLIAVGPVIGAGLVRALILLLNHGSFL
jgi:hypothetical protein